MSRTAIDEETGEVYDVDEYLEDVRVNSLFAGVPREKTWPVDSLLYVLDLWSKKREKFNESDWVRNSGRFARYVGQGGGGGGGSSGGAASEEALRFGPVWEADVEGMAALQDEVNAHFPKIEVTPSQRAALVAYAGDSGYASINGELRHPERVDRLLARAPEVRRASMEANREKVRAQIAEIDAVMEKASSPEMIVYRGFGFEGRGLKPGDTFGDRAYTSTSANALSAANFSSNPRGTPTVGEIRLPQGSRAVVLNPLLSASGERPPGVRNEGEVLIDRGGVYRVVGARTDTLRYTTPTGRRTAEVNILEVEIVPGGEGVPQLGEEKARRSGRQPSRFEWTDDDIVLLSKAETRKFVESDWVRNSGRFADYVGRGDSGGGGTSGSGAVESRVEGWDDYTQVVYPDDPDLRYTSFLFQDSVTAEERTHVVSEARAAVNLLRDSEYGIEPGVVYPAGARARAPHFTALERIRVTKKDNEFAARVDGWNRVEVNLGPKEAIAQRYDEAQREWADTSTKAPAYVGTRLSETLVHETGHHLEAAWPSRTARQIAPDALEGYESISTYGWSNEAEFIAESFAGRVLNRENRNLFPEEGITHFLSGETILSRGTHDRIHEANLKVTKSRKTTMRDAAKAVEAIPGADCTVMFGTLRTPPEGERSRPRRAKTHTLDDIPTSRKFNESEWVRSSGRFADFLGHRRGGGASASATSNVKKTKLDLDKVEDPAIRKQLSDTVNDLMGKYPGMDGYIKSIEAQPLGSFTVGEFTGSPYFPKGGQSSIRLEPSFMTKEKLETLKAESRDRALNPGFEVDPVKAAVSHEFGHAVMSKLHEPYWENQSDQTASHIYQQVYFVVQETSPNSRYAETNAREAFAEAFSERYTMPRTKWSASAHAMDELLSEASREGYFD